MKHRARLNTLLIIFLLIHIVIQLFSIHKTIERIKQLERIGKQLDDTNKILDRGK